VACNTVSAEDIRDAFTFTKFEPAGMVRKRQQQERDLSILDYSLPQLAVSDLDRTDLAHVRLKCQALTASDAEIKKRLNVSESRKTAQRGRWSSQEISQTAISQPECHRSGMRRRHGRGDPGLWTVQAQLRSYPRAATVGVNTRSDAHQHGTQRAEAKMQGYEGESCGELRKTTPLVRNGNLHEVQHLRRHVRLQLKQLSEFDEKTSI